MSFPSAFTKLITRLTGDPAQGATWLGVDRMVRLGLSFIVQLLVVRHLGPADSGVLQSGLALAAILAVGVELGLDGVLRRELVRHPGRAGALLGTATLLRLGALLPGAALFLVLYTTPAGVPRELARWLGVSVALPLATTLEVWFLAQGLVRTNVLAQGATFVTGAIIRVGMVLAGAGLIPFGRMIALETLLLALTLAWAYAYCPAAPRNWRWDRILASELLRDAAPLLCTNLAIFVYRRIDLVMISHLLDPVSTGLYAAAMRISELGYLAPMIMINAWFPRLTQLHAQDPQAYHTALAEFFRRVTWAAALFAAGVTVVSPWVMRLLFGAPFAGAGTPLALHVWTGVFIAHGIARNQWLTLDNRQIDGLWLALSGAVANVALNILLIPRLGINGAALAAVGALVLNMAVVPACFARTRAGWRLGWRATFGLKP